MQKTLLALIAATCLTTPALSDCGLMSIGSNRMDFTPGLWAALGQVAQERGYVDE